MPFYRHHYPISSYYEKTNKEINMEDYLQFDPNELNGWGMDFIIAGEFIHNILINNHKNSKHIDFCILSTKGFNKIIDFFQSNWTNIIYHILEDGVYLNIIGYPFKVKLHNLIDWSIENCINSYDYDYNKTYFNGSSIKISPDCDHMIKEKKIYHIPTSIIPYISVLESMNNGYKFNNEMLVELGIRDIELEIPDVNNPEKKKFIGHEYQDLTEDEKEKLLKIVNDNHQFEIDESKYIISLYSSNDIEKLLPMLSKHKVFYYPNCACIYCDSETEVNEKIYESLPIDPKSIINFRNIIDFLHNNI